MQLNEKKSFCKGIDNTVGPRKKEVMNEGKGKEENFKENNSNSTPFLLNLANQISSESCEVRAKELIGPLGDVHTPGIL